MHIHISAILRKTSTRNAQNNFRILAREIPYSNLRDSTLALNPCAFHARACAHFAMFVPQHLVSPAGAMRTIFCLQAGRVIY